MRYLLPLLLLAACVKPGTEESASSKKLFGSDPYVVTVDDCEYIIWDGYNKGGMVHKANCKNHRRDTVWIENGQIKYSIK